MDAHQIETVELLISDLGMTIVQIQDRFFVGTIEIPDETQKHCTLIGKEVTHFFKVESIRKAAEQLKTDITTFTNNTSVITIKFNVNTPWYSYSK